MHINNLVRPDGFEPPTPCSEDRCSNPLSYGRIVSYTMFTNMLTEKEPDRDYTEPERS